MIRMTKTYALFRNVHGLIQKRYNDVHAFAVSTVHILIVLLLENQFTQLFHIHITFINTTLFRNPFEFIRHTLLGEIPTISFDHAISCRFQTLHLNSKKIKLFSSLFIIVIILFFNLVPFLRMSL